MPAGAASCCPWGRAPRPGGWPAGWSRTPARWSPTPRPRGGAGWGELLAAGVVLLAAGVPLGLGRYAALGHATGPRSFAVRSGFLIEEQAILQPRAVVGWRVRQTFFQRRAGLATVVACVGAGSGGYAAVDLSAADVAAFTEAASEPWASALDPRGAALNPRAS